MTEKQKSEYLFSRYEKAFEQDFGVQYIEQNYVIKPKGKYLFFQGGNVQQDSWYINESGTYAGLIKHEGSSFSGYLLKFLMEIEGYSFEDAILEICNEYNIFVETDDNLSEKNNPPKIERQRTQREPEKPKELISIQFGDFSDDELMYWEDRKISRETLIANNVRPIRSFEQHNPNNDKNNWKKSGLTFCFAYNIEKQGDKIVGCHVKTPKMSLIEGSKDLLLGVQPTSLLGLDKLDTKLGFMIVCYGIADYLSAVENAPENFNFMDAKAEALKLPKAIVETAQKHKLRVFAMPDTDFQGRRLAKFLPENHKNIKIITVPKLEHQYFREDKRKGWIDLDGNQVENPKGFPKEVNYVEKHGYKPEKNDLNDYICTFGFDDDLIKVLETVKKQPEKTENQQEGKPMLDQEYPLILSNAVELLLQMKESTSHLYFLGGVSKSFEGSKLNNLPIIGYNSGIEFNGGRCPKQLQDIIKAIRPKQVVFLQDDLFVVKDPKKDVYYQKKAVFNLLFNLYSGINKLKIQNPSLYSICHPLGKKTTFEKFENVPFEKLENELQNGHEKTENFKKHKFEIFDKEKIHQYLNLNSADDFWEGYQVKKGDNYASLDEFSFKNEKYYYDEESSELKKADTRFFGLVKSKKEEYQLKINHTNLRLFLEKNGFYQIESDIIPDLYELVRIVENQIQRTNPTKIKHFILDYIQQLPTWLEFDIGEDKPRSRHKDELVEIYTKGINTYIGADKLSLLAVKRPKFLQDTWNTAYFTFRNGFVTITKDEIKLLPYKNLPKGFAIWEHDKIDRDFKAVNIPINPNQIGKLMDDSNEPPEESKYNFIDFVHRISNNDEQKIKSWRSMVGYLLHDYFGAKTKAIILTDKTLDSEPAGRTGKGITAKSLEPLRKTAIIPGKEFNTNSDHRYQLLDADSKIMVLDDVKANFDLATQFNAITEGVMVNKKNQQAFKIYIKMLINTNMGIRGSSDSYRDRMAEFEMERFFSADRSPTGFYQDWFFSERWSKESWQVFDNFMLSNVQLYLKLGEIFTVEADNLQERKFKEATSEEFYKFCLDKDFEMNTAKAVNSKGLDISCEYDKAEVFDIFLEQYPDFAKWKLSQRKFTTWLKQFAIYSNCSLGERRSNSRDLFFFVEKKNSAKVQ